MKEVRSYTWSSTEPHLVCVRVLPVASAPHLLHSVQRDSQEDQQQQAGGAGTHPGGGH